MENKKEKKSFFARVFEKAKEKEDKESKSVKKDNTSFTLEELQFFDMMDD